MLFAGKARPDRKSMKKRIEEGFRFFELYLKKSDLDNLKRTINELEFLKRKYKIKIVSVHTPHTPKDFKSYAEKTVELAKKYNAFAIIHNSKSTIDAEIKIAKTLRYEKILLENEIFPLKEIKSKIFKNGLNLVFDVGHLYRASNSFYVDAEHLFNSFSERIFLIHVNDSTKNEDNLAIGEGKVDFKRILKIIKDSKFKGPIVVEVPQNREKEGIDKIKEINKML